MLELLRLWLFNRSQFTHPSWAGPVPLGALLLESSPGRPFWRRAPLSQSVGHNTKKKEHYWETIQFLWLLKLLNGSPWAIAALQKLSHWFIATIQGKRHWPVQSLIQGTLSMLLYICTEGTSVRAREFTLTELEHCCGLLCNKCLLILHIGSLVLTACHSFCQCDTNPHIPGKKESQLKNCLHQIGLLAFLWGIFLTVFEVGVPSPWWMVSFLSK